MSEQTQNTNQMMVIGLVVVAVLLAAIAGILIYQQNQASKLPAPVVSGTTTPGAADGTDAAAGTGMPAGMTDAMGASAEVDPETATKVPEDMTPVEFVKAYHEAVQAGEYEKAYKMLPLNKQQSYGNAEAYAEQVKAYAISGYELGEATEEEDTVTIVATQVTPQMPIGYLWTLKKIDGAWYCVSRTMGTP
jgi:hypothetical protein